MENLSGIFKNNLKKFLPQYYDATGDQRHYAQLKDYHMHQRWEVSGQRIAEFAAGR
jgi:hypothetical protein